MRIRFSIRDLLWLTLVVALAVGWWVTVQDLKRRYGRQGNNLKQLPPKALERLKAEQK